jgi:flagellar basal-body rod modification protein FlgD
MASAAINPTTATSGLNLNDLLQVLLTELTNQDPLKPVDNTQFMAQIAQFTTLETTQEVNQNIQQLVALQAITQTVGLIGRNVSALTDSGTTVAGRVTDITFVNGAPQLTISKADSTVVPGIAIGNLQTIQP